MELGTGMLITAFDYVSMFQVVSGNRVLPFSTPLAHRYGGHQFGYWSGQLGDGRAHILGEYVNSRGERWHLQLKGMARTELIHVLISCIWDNRVIFTSILMRL